MSTHEIQRQRYLDALGVTRWEPRHKPQASSSSAMQAASSNLSQKIIDSVKSETHKQVPADVSAMDWTALEAAVRVCTKCPLHATRTQAVFGVGNRQAQWMFVGEAPGADEDRLGEPFVGRAGKLLNAMLFAAGLKREEVYIANVLKSRPPANRDPQPEEVAQCEPYLIRQIELIRPRLIVALGRHAAHSLLKTEMSLAKLRGQKLSYHGTPLIVTYHPAYLLRNPIDKRKVWDDLCLAKKILEPA